MAGLGLTERYSPSSIDPPVLLTVYTTHTATVLQHENRTFRVSESVRFNVPLDICTIGHFGDESFQAINCTGTDNQKQ